MLNAKLRAFLAGGLAVCVVATGAQAETIKVWSRQTDESVSVLKALTDAFTADTGITVEALIPALISNSGWHALRPVETCPT